MSEQPFDLVAASRASDPYLVLAVLDFRNLRTDAGALLFQGINPLVLTTRRMEKR
jgi:hypothetical protein